MEKKENKQKKVYESDKVVGSSHWEALQWITGRDLWDEVIDLEVDCYRTVIKVIH